MGQREIITWLRERRLNGSNRYYTVEEIKIGICCHNDHVFEQVNKLYLFGFLDCRTEGIINRYGRRRFRLKKQFI